MRLQIGVGKMFADVRDFRPRRSASDLEQEVVGTSGDAAEKKC
jgi:hypothetical protein